MDEAAAMSVRAMTTFKSNDNVMVIADAIIRQELS